MIVNSICRQMHSGPFLRIEPFDAIIDEGARAGAKQEAKLIRFYRTERAMSREKSIIAARKGYVQFVAKAYIAALKFAVMYWATEYYNRYPEHRRTTGELKTVRGKKRPIYTLHGFEPQWIQSIFVPGQNTGRPGLKSGLRLLQRMSDDTAS